MARDLRRLSDLVARLRGPDGCPWDREQGLADLRAYLLEEAHETASAIDGVAADGSWEALGQELGDLLFQVVFVAALAEESGAFTLDQVIEAIHAKMVARHPHVFGGAELADAAAVREAWERRKLAEERRLSLLDGVPASLPALVAAYRMTQKAAGVGFDWPEPAAVLAKLEEELAELRAALAGPPDRSALQDEVGDLLFTIANLARKLGVDPEAALAQTNRKFRRRFARVETGLRARGRPLGEASLDEMDALWEDAKREER
jgi:ATP diphosphatase